MGEKFLTPLYIWEELIHSYSQLCFYHYAKISKEHNLGVKSVYHQTSDDIQSNPANLLSWLKCPAILP